MLGENHSDQPDELSQLDTTDPPGQSPEQPVAPGETRDSRKLVPDPQKKNTRSAIHTLRHF